MVSVDSASVPYNLSTHFTQTIIEADGENTQPNEVDQIHIFAGQRYSFVLNANQPNRTYWIRAIPNIAPNSTDITTGVNAAVLRYHNKGYSSPPMPDYKYTPPIRKPLTETSLRPLVHSPGGVPGVHKRGAADVNINLQIYGANGIFTINDGRSNASLSPPLTTPVLLKILSGAVLPQDILPKGDLITLPPNKVIEISIPAHDTGGPVGFSLFYFTQIRIDGYYLPSFSTKHPIHLHGVRETL